ncbi:MAG: GntR family transcriptional regulator [Pseudorhodobacter sp.]
MKNSHYDCFDRAEINPVLPIAPQVYDVLRSRIVDNRLTPGAPLSEATLAARLNISRTPLRAALQQLANEGLIITRPQVGSVVAKLDTAQLEEAIFVRAALEEAVVRRLTGIGPHKDMLETSFAAQQRAAEADDYAAFFREDELFHARLATLAGVANTWKLVHAVKGHVDRQRFRLMSRIPFRAMRAFRDHQQIVGHILAGNGDDAARAMRAHVHSALELPPTGHSLSAGHPSAALEAAHQGDRQE